MARSLIAVMGASSLLVLAATLGGAAAQTAGSPLPLLQIDHATTAVRAHHKAAVRVARTSSRERPDHRHTAKHIARRVHARTRVADAARDLPAPPATPPQAAPQNNSRNIWPTPATAPLGYAATDSNTAALAPSAASPSVTTEQVVETNPNGTLNGGLAVPAVMPAPVTPAVAAPNPQPATARPTAPSPTPPLKVATATPAGPKPAVRAMLFRLSTSSPVGSALWIAQLLAALGGAIAAGAIAWFLIRPKPEQNYG